MTNIVSALRVTPTGRPSVQRRPNRQHLDMTALQRVRNLPHVLPPLLGRTATTRPRRSGPLSSSSRLNSEWPSDWLPWASRRQPRLASRLSNALSARRKSAKKNFARLRRRTHVARRNVNAGLMMSLLHLLRQKHLAKSLHQPLRRHARTRRTSHSMTLNNPKLRSRDPRMALPKRLFGSSKRHSTQRPGAWSMYVLESRKPTNSCTESKSDYKRMTWTKNVRLPRLDFALLRSKCSKASSRRRRRRNAEQRRKEMPKNRKAGWRLSVPRLKLRKSGNDNCSCSWRLWMTKIRQTTTTVHKTSHPRTQHLPLAKSCPEISRRRQHFPCRFTKTRHHLLLPARLHLL
jgi:hypothetical protein